MPSKYRITVYLPEDVKLALKQQANREHRSESNLAAAILIDYVRNRQKNEPPTE